VDAVPDVAWLAEARRLAQQAGALLVFDEIKTAFRIAVGGAAERYGVVPDLIAVGKALGNGFPIAALLGSGEVMDAVTRTWISSTLATEYVSLAAVRAVLEVYERQHVIEHLAQVGAQLENGLIGLARAYPELVEAVRGVPQMCYLALRDDDRASDLASKLAQRGILFKRTAYNFVSLAHTPAVVDRVLEELDRTLNEMAATC
jgi:glutamate-1-semialdehyde aminotransferase